MSETPVIHIIPTLRVGGAENMLATLVTAARSEPIAPLVINLGNGGELSDVIRKAGVPLYELGMQRASDLPFTLMRLTRLIRKLKPAAIQSWLYYADLIALWALQLSGRRPLTRLYWGVRCSDMDQSRYGTLLRWSIATCARLSNGPDAVVANSFAGRTIHRKIGYHPRAFPIIPNGIDTERFRPDDNARASMRRELGIEDRTPIVLHVARVDPMKDHDSLVAVAAAMPEVRFVLVGHRTQALAVPGNVTALGVRRDTPALYAAADFLLTTSAFGEGFPTVIGEAMASGVPVVATDVGDARCIVDETGLIVPPRNPVAIASALRTLLAETATLHRARADACRTRIENHYSLSRAVAAFDALHLHGILPGEDSHDMSEGCPS
ncbi:MAG: glycosyltransferase [Pseudomonadota bacterium]